MHVVAVSRSATHSFSKPVVDEIELICGIGVHGDAHAGRTVQHLFPMRQNPDAPNLRQVHLIHDELFNELAGAGYTITPGAMGENITTHGIDLLGLPRGAVLRLGGRAVVQITGLRNPCAQLNQLGARLMKQLVFTGADGQVVRKSGVMGVIVTGGMVRAGDPITVELPEHHEALQPV